MAGKKSVKTGGGKRTKSSRKHIEDEGLAKGGSSKQSALGGNLMIFGLVIAVALLIIYNQALISDVESSIANTNVIFQTEKTTLEASGGASEVESTGDPLQDAIRMIPTGTPAYGEEFGVTFDDPQGSINVLKAFDKKMPIEDKWRGRYIKIGMSISCEYCCSAKMIVFEDGRAACGCAHSYAMRGLIKVLLEYHPDEYTDDQILEELIRWKTLFFPKQMTKKYLEKVAEGGDVGALDMLDEMPNMVGGC